MICCIYVFTFDINIIFNNNYMPKKNGKRGKTGKPNTLPFVSVCTPTFNRRPFIRSMIKCFDHQDYPKNRMEWIIIDDGSDHIEDLIKDHPNVKYFKYDEKMSLGKKRNLMHQKSCGEIIVYMDDDDYYPPQRVSHAVDMLTTHPKALCAGSSEIYIYFHELQKIYQFGPYSPTHATAGTFAFKRKLLEDHAYNDDAALAEEKAFLKNYSVPFVQLEPKKVILVFSHEHNTFDKRKLLSNKNEFIKESDKDVDFFVKETDLKQFYMTQIHEDLKDYPAGEPVMKPDVLKQTKEIEERRQQEANNNGKIVMQDKDGNSKELSTPEVVNIIQSLQRENEMLKQNGANTLTMETPQGNRQISLQETVEIIKALQQENMSLKSNIKDHSVNSTQNDVNMFDNNNKQFIITDEDDNMEILDQDEINDYINTKIDLIKSLRNNSNVAIENTVEKTKEKENDTDYSALLKRFDDIERKLDGLTKTDNVDNAANDAVNDAANDTANDTADRNAEAQQLTIEINGENKRLTNNEVYEIIQKQQSLIELCKREIQDRTIYFNDQTGDKMELTQGIFDFIVSKMNTSDDDSLDKTHNNTDDEDTNEEKASDDNLSNSSESSENSNIDIDAHGNKSSNISFDVVSCS
jgi:glycosyltransferase involved in cell wall biosynthesis